MARKPRMSSHAAAEQALDKLVATMPDPPRAGAPRRKLVVPGLEVELPSRKKSIINTATKTDEAKQSIATPWRFIRALEYRFGTPVDFDLAASDDNHKSIALRYFTEKHDALTCDWGSSLGQSLGGHDGPSKLAYLNPPFAHIRPWARKLAACRWLRRWTCMLVPASYSATWFQELKGKVQIDAIPRIQFEGATGLYPKELVLITAGYGVNGEGYWDWYTDYFHRCQDSGEPFQIPEVKGGRPRVYLPDLVGTPCGAQGRLGDLIYQSPE